MVAFVDGFLCTDFHIKLKVGSIGFSCFCRIIFLKAGLL